MSSAPRFPIAALLPLLLGACATDRAVDVSLRGVPPGAAALVVTTALDGRASAEGPRRLGADLDRFTLLLGDATGHLRVEVAAQGPGSDEPLGRGAGAVDLGPAPRYALPIELAPAAEGPAAPAPALFPEPSCAIAGAFCTENPLPHGYPFQSLFGAAPDDLWLSGGGALRDLLHFDGTAFRRVPVPPLVPQNGPVTALWGPGPRDLFALQLDRVFHFDGTTFAFDGQIPPPAVAWALSGAGPADVLAVGWDGQRGVVWRRDEKGWSAASRASPAQLLSVWVPGPGQGWAVGDGGTVLRRDGGVFSLVPSGTARLLRQVWGSGPSDVWIVGDGGTVLRYDGARLAPVETGRGEDLGCVTGSGPEDIWLAGAGVVLRTDRGRLREVPSDAPIRDAAALYSSGPGAVWLATTGGALLRGDAAGLRLQNGVTAEDLRAVSGTAPDDLWIAGDHGALLHRGAAGLPRVPSGTSATLRAVHALARGRAWAVGDGGTMIEIDGASARPVAPVTSQDLRAVFGLAPGDLWAAGSAGLLRLQGEGAPWRVYPLPRAYDLHAIFGTAPDDLWAAGEGTILHYDGRSWTQALSEPGRLTALWGPARDDLWATLGSTPLFHYDGRAWSRAAGAYPRGLTAAGALGGTGPGDLWAGGEDAPALARLTGGTWSEQSPAPGQPVLGLFGVGGHLFAVGRRGLVLHRLP